MSNNKIDVSKCELIHNDNRCFGGQKQGIGNNCHKSDYCEYNHDCYYKQIQRLKAENEELRSDNSMLLAQGDADTFTIGNLNFKIQKLQQCLDDIEDILSDSCITSYDICIMLEKIKEVKGNEQEKR